MAIEKVVGRINGLSRGAKKILNGAKDGWKAGYNSMSSYEKDAYWMGVTALGAGAAVEAISKK